MGLTRRCPLERVEYRVTYGVSYLSEYPNGRAGVQNSTLAVAQFPSLWSGTRAYRTLPCLDLHRFVVWSVMISISTWVKGLRFKVLVGENLLLASFNRTPCNRSMVYRKRTVKSSQFKSLSVEPYKWIDEFRIGL
uniref:WGS project CBMG000000000 data, contig CS5907-c001726 n=1 Tax=Fusarium acuminatum CS5907 TaxID=1318461 RepID=A0A090M965_9HYPO|nr:unnamed protein product [Fusarium acuminatum CS5907]